jgi:PhnB protein
MTVAPYAIFNGTCKAAMEFYKSHIGGELFMLTYGQAPEANCPASAKDKIIHANLKNGNFMMMASDSPTNEAKMGDNMQLYLTCASRADVDRLYESLSKNGAKKVAPADTFWGAYFAMVEDQFGVQWMLGFEIKK